MKLLKKDKIILFGLLILVILSIYVYYNKQENMDESQKLLRDMIVKNILSTNMSITYKDSKLLINLMDNQFDYYNLQQNRDLSLLIITDIKIYLIGRTLNYMNDNSENITGITVYDFINPQKSFQYLTTNQFLISYDKKDTIILEIVNLNKRDINGNQLNHKFIIDKNILNNPENIVSMKSTENIDIYNALINDTTDSPIIKSYFDLTKLDVYTKYKKELSQIQQNQPQQIKQIQPQQIKQIQPQQIQPQQIQQNQPQQIQPQQIQQIQPQQIQPQQIQQIQQNQNKCKDQNNNCQVWSKKGECLANPVYMIKNCPNSCNSCNLTPEVFNIINSQYNRLNNIKTIVNKL